MCSRLGNGGDSSVVDGGKAFLDVGGAETAAREPTHQFFLGAVAWGGYIYSRIAHNAYCRFPQK